MKVYQGTWSDGDCGVQLVWGANASKVERDTKRAAKENGGEFMGVQDYEIPQSKAGLINWLNSHFTTDNG